MIMFEHNLGLLSCNLGTVIAVWKSSYPLKTKVVLHMWLLEVEIKWSNLPEITNTAGTTIDWVVYFSLLLHTLLLSMVCTRKQRQSLASTPELLNFPCHQLLLCQHLQPSLEHSRSTISYLMFHLMGHDSGVALL